MAQQIITPVAYPPRASLGSLDEILAARQQMLTNALAGNLSPQGASAARMAMLEQMKGINPNPTISGLQSQLGGQMLPVGNEGPALRALNAAPLRAPALPVTSSGEVLAGAGMTPRAPLAISAGSATTQAGAVNASRAAGNAAFTAEDLSALRGGSAPLATSSNGGLMSQLRNGVMAGDPAMGGGLAAYTGGGAMGALKTGAARFGQGLAFGLVPQVIGSGVEAFGGPIEDALGLEKGSTKGTANVGADMAQGAMIGTLVAPGPGTLVGEALMGMKHIVPLAGELISDIAGSGVAQKWGKVTDNFNKIITKTDAGTVGKNGVKYLNQNYLAAAQEIKRKAEKGEIGHEDAVTAMQRINSMMKKDIRTLKAQKEDKSTSTKKRTAVQIQMGEAMDKLAQSSIAQGNAAQATLQNLAADPNMAAIAPVLQASGDMRAQWGQQMHDAYTGAAYMDIPQQKLDEKIAYLHQLQQQIQAQQDASGGGGGSTSLADLAAQVK